MICKICNHNETDSTSGICWECFYKWFFNRRYLLEDIEKEIEKPLKMKQIGKQGKQWIKARAKLKKEYEERGITTCEARLEGCMRTFALSFHHRHKRYFYIGKPELLGDFNQVILVCASCHHILEGSKDLTEEIFKLLK